MVNWWQPADPRKQADGRTAGTEERLAHVRFVCVCVLINGAFRACGQHRIALQPSCGACAHTSPVIYCAINTRAPCHDDVFCEAERMARVPSRIVSLVVRSGHGNAGIEKLVPCFCRVYRISDAKCCHRSICKIRRVIGYLSRTGLGFCVCF